MSQELDWNVRFIYKTQTGQHSKNIGRHDMLVKLFFPQIQYKKHLKDIFLHVTHWNVYAKYVEILTR